MEYVKKGAVWLLSAVCAVLLVLLMLFYRSEAKDAQKLAKELTQELVKAEEALDDRIALESKQNEIVAAARNTKAVGQEKTNAAIKVVEREGSRIPLDVHSIEQLRLRSSQARQAALDNASRGN